MTAIDEINALLAGMEEREDLRVSGCDAEAECSERGEEKGCLIAALRVACLAMERVSYEAPISSLGEHVREAQAAILAALKGNDDGKK